MLGGRFMRQWEIREAIMVLRIIEGPKEIVGWISVGFLKINPRIKVYISALHSRSTESEPDALRVSCHFAL